jgi:hypothetical protein
MRTLVLLATLSLIGCESNDWELAPRAYSCTPEQMGRVQTETLWCTKNGGYIESYCYGAAIMRLCDPRAASAALHGKWEVGK